MAHFTQPQKAAVKAYILSVLELAAKPVTGFKD